MSNSLFKKLESNQIEFLKWIAIITMVIDHYSKIVLGENYILESIGRIAMPIFAFLIAHNYLFFTKNKEKYIGRLFFFALISQPVYSYVFESSTLNILFTLLFGVLNIYVYEKIKEKTKKNLEILISYAFVNLLTILIGFFVDYAFFGIYIVVFSYFAFSKNIFSFMPPIFSILANIPVGFQSLFSLISFILIYVSSKIRFNIKKSNKWFFYLFYPVHLILLFLFKSFFFL